MSNKNKNKKAFERVEPRGPIPPASVVVENDKPESTAKSEDETLNFSRSDSKVVKENPFKSTEASSNSSKEEIEEFSGDGIGLTRFQSEEARSALNRAVESSEEIDEPVDGRINVDPPKVQVRKVNEYETKVQVRPRVSHMRVRYGKDWYQLEANKRTIVPKHFAIILEQKGII